MLLSELIFAAQAILKEEGDLPVCSGVNRCGYGEEAVSLDVLRVKLMGEDQKLLVVDIVMSDETSYETSLEAILPDLE